MNTLALVLFRSSKTFLGLSLAVLLGAHWLLLQSVAWVGMIITYSQTWRLIVGGRRMRHRLVSKKSIA